MSEDFEAVFTSFLNNKVPAMWHKRGYNSLKSLGSWIHDLTLRLDFIEVSFSNIMLQFQDIFVIIIYYIVTNAFQTTNRKVDIILLIVYH